MPKDLREAALWELVMKATKDLQAGSAQILTKNAGVISLDKMLSRMAKASNEDFEYAYCLYACMIAGLSYKIMFDLMSEADIQQMLTESEAFRNEIHAN